MKNSFSDLTYDELLLKREELKAKMREHRFNKVLGHVENPVEKRNLRRSVARLNAIIHEYALGIRVPEEGRK
ncbi:50S ribosomal protein L29 [Marispirochaeta sp.]|jgi:large subunit ribosomal protein L29|uniref:50S ribosomal protein L29 n=1 Tax=Marispirochaeta sp. TaxID=2038653 RepID=UPI0029C6ACAD|nr:50S ribosomal protein L29 [Marispirochaeta sp.]